MSRFQRCATLTHASFSKWRSATESADPDDTTVRCRRFRDPPTAHGRRRTRHRPVPLPIPFSSGKYNRKIVVNFSGRRTDVRRDSVSLDCSIRPLPVHSSSVSATTMSPPDTDRIVSMVSGRRRPESSGTCDRLSSCPVGIHQGIEVLLEKLRDVCLPAITTESFDA